MVRHRLLRWVPGVAGLGLLLCPGAGGIARAGSAPSERDIKALAAASTREAARKPAVYRLKWVIPHRDFPAGGRKRFLFPALKHPSQTFTFTLEGAARFHLVRLPDWTLVDIWPREGSDVTVLGNATIYPQAVDAKEAAALAAVPLKPAPEAKTGALYYYDERIDPAYGPCRELAGSLKRASAYQTMQAILDWRAANITYEDPPAGNTLETVLASHHGVCHHSAYLVACLARADGIPAYVVGGVVLPDKLGPFENHEGSHGWGEVELPGVGRIAYESQNNGSLRDFSARRCYLRFGGQDFTRPWHEIKDLRDYVSLQGYRVSGERIE